MIQTLDNTAAIILAAGRGTRLAGTTSKVLRPLLGKPMISYIISTLKHVPIQDIYVVTGHMAEDVQGALGRGVNYATQQEQLGTAHAVKAALEELPINIETAIVFQVATEALDDSIAVRLPRPQREPQIV